MTEIMIETAEEDFLNHDFASAYKWAISAKMVDPFYPSVDQYLEAYRVHWTAANRKTPTGEIDWYAVLCIKERLSRSYKMITHTYVQLAKEINPDNHSSAAAPGAYKLITTAWEILSDSKSRLAFHARAGFPLPTCSCEEEQSELEVPIKKPNWATKRRRQEKPEPEVTVKKANCAPKRRRPEIAVKKGIYAPKRHRVDRH